MENDAIIKFDFIGGSLTFTFSILKLWFFFFLATTAIVMKNPGEALELGIKSGSAAAFRSPKAACSRNLDVICFHYTGKVIYVGIFLQIND